MNSNVLLNANNICAGYNKREILHNASITVPRGDIVSLIGPNGAGKTTLLKVIAGLLKARKGDICFNNEDLTHLPIHRRINSGIGYFLQGGKIFKNLTGEDNLLIGAGAMENDQIKERMREIYEFFPEIGNHRRKRAGLLSGGEKQMLALGIILMRKPKLLLLDEPSAGLAPKYSKGIFSKIQQMNKAFNISILLVEQRVKEAINVSNKVYMMTEGRIVEENHEPEKLLKSSKLQRIFFGQEM